MSTPVKPQTSTDTTTRPKSRASGHSLSSRVSTSLDYQELEAQDEDVSITEDIYDKESGVSDGKDTTSM